METAALVAPITALEFLQDEYLLKGEGPILTVYSLHPHPKSCASLSVLQHYRIHGIRPRPQQADARHHSTTESRWEEKGGSPATESKHYDLAVFGGKAVRLVRLRTELHSGDHLHLETIGPLMELQDWALDVYWLSEEGRPLLGVALAHNRAFLLDAEKGKALVQCSCLEGCLLYSALLLVDKSWTDSVLVGGTVFNQLVLWRPGSGGTEGNEAQLKAPVERRLLGHSGVIFSLSYLQEKGWLASASDDRSVRVWGVGVLGGPGGKCGDLNPTCLRVLYGHQARVFSVRLSPGKVYSAGEDGACLVWDWAADGKVARTLKGHRAGGVRALAVSEGKVHDARQAKWVATGGADGGVRLWRLEGDKEKDVKESGVTNGEAVNEMDMKFTGQGMPKAVCVTGGENRTNGLTEFKILVCTDQGIVYQYCDEQWELLWQGPVEFQSYCVMETLAIRMKDSSSTVHLCAVGNLIGGVQVFPVSKPKSGVLLSGGQGKIHSLIWVGAQESGRQGGYLLASGAGGLVHRWYVEVDMDEDSHMALRVATLPTFLLPLCAKRWLTAAVRLHSRTPGALWVCGDRRGSLLLFLERRKCEQSEKEEEGRRQDLLIVRTDSSKAEENGDNKRHGDSVEEKDGGLMEVRKGTGECYLPLKPASCLFGVHGKQGVTSVCEYRGLLYSTGRDGCVRVFRSQTTDKLETLEENTGADNEEKRVGHEGLQLEVLRVQRACKGMEWLERVLILEPELSVTDFPERSQEEEGNCKEDRETSIQTVLKNPGEEMQKDVSSQGRGKEETKRVIGGREARFAIAGFHAVHFVVWDPVRQERLLSVPCGGGHRSWGLWPSHKAVWPGHGTLVFIKQGAVMASQPPSEVSIWAGKAGKTGAWGLREGVHGRAIGCVCRLGRMEGASSSNEVHTQAKGQTDQTAGAEESSEGHWEILVTGGEDTSLSVLAIKPNSGEVQVLSVITDHISSVRTLAAITDSGQGTGGGREMEGPKQAISALLVSAGGRAQLQCYRLLISRDGQRQLPSCQVIQVASHRLDEQWERRRNRHKMVKMDPETRYMSIEVVKEGKDCVLLALACSDGAVRLFSVSEVKGHFELLWESFYHHRCVLSLATCWMKDEEGNRHVLLFSAATDGKIAVWDVTTAASTLASSMIDTPAPPIPCLSIPAHQNGINSLVVWAESAKQQEDGCWVTVASGGDDGQLTVSMVRVQYLVDAIEGSRVLSPAEEPLLEEPGSPLHNQALSQLQAPFQHQTGLSVAQKQPLSQPQLKNQKVQIHSQFKPCRSQSPLLSHQHTHPETLPSTPPPCPDSPQPLCHVHLHLQSQSRVPLAHAAPLTALKLLSPGLLVSTSPDQRICLWKVRSTGIAHSGTFYSHVADAAGMAVWKGGMIEEKGRRGERGVGRETETGRESETVGSESGLEAACKRRQTLVRIDGEAETDAGVVAGADTRGAGCSPDSETVSEARAGAQREAAAGKHSSDVGHSVKTLRAGWVLACGQGLQLIRVTDVETDGGMELEEQRKRGATEQRVTVTFEENRTWKDES